ncbi:MAG: hypothetical protein J3K34DRAFT_210949 [Monoraphidium minutum]|nr:MAG: hypothetical protein J3K34DRAFT_210949 [Monoraphidium minutum]
MRGTKPKCQTAAPQWADAPLVAKMRLAGQPPIPLSMAGRARHTCAPVCCGVCACNAPLVTLAGRVEASPRAAPKGVDLMASHSLAWHMKRPSPRCQQCNCGRVVLGCVRRWGLRARARARLALHVFCRQRALLYRGASYSVLVAGRFAGPGLAAGGRGAASEAPSRNVAWTNQRGQGAVCISRVRPASRRGRHRHRRRSQRGKGGRAGRERVRARQGCGRAAGPPAAAPRPRFTMGVWQGGRVQSRAQMQSHRAGRPLAGRRGTRGAHRRPPRRARGAAAPRPAPAAAAAAAA